VDRPRELAAYIRLTIQGLDGPPMSRPPRVRLWFVSQELMRGRRLRDRFAAISWPAR
jgi:hypothetical protein